ncbi:hypothetical protein ACSNOI_03635 [Actinomadura kijaniata]|uniref:hypothetical protein n=1 Tax=Actinomadura kijaniata TaxID=46161 RepID=UPI003F1B8813
MPKSFPVRANIALALTLLTITTSCQQQPKGPTAAQAEQTLKTQIGTALEGAAARNARVTDSGGRDIACEKSKAKRTYAVTAEIDSSELSPVEIKNGITGRLLRNTQFTVTRDDNATYDSSSTRLDLHNRETKTSITISIPSQRQLIINGQTNCLRAS